MPSTRIPACSLCTVLASTGPEEDDMPSTLTQACPFCGLRYANRPLLELHIREDHLQRNHRGGSGHDDPGDTRTSQPRAGVLSRGHGLAPRPARSTNEAIAVTATRRPRRPSPGWVIRTFRYVKETLLLASQALFPPADAPAPPGADASAERHAHPAPAPEHADRAA